MDLLTCPGQQTLYYIEVSFLSPAFFRAPLLRSYRKLFFTAFPVAVKKLLSLFYIILLFIESLPRLPYIRLIPNRRLLPISNNRLLEYHLILQHLLRLIFLSNVLDQRKKILVFAVLVDHSFQAADRLQNRLEFTFAQPFFLKIYELEFDSALFEITLRFPCVTAFLCAKNLYYQL